MAGKLLRFLNGMLTCVIVIALIATGSYAGFALWDNQQVYDATENVVSEMREIRPDMDSNQGPTGMTMSQLIADYENRTTDQPAEQPAEAEAVPAQGAAEQESVKPAETPQTLPAQVAEADYNAESAEAGPAEVQTEAAADSRADNTDDAAAEAGQPEPEPEQIVQTETATVNDNTAGGAAVPEAETGAPLQPEVSKGEPQAPMEENTAAGKSAVVAAPAEEETETTPENVPVEEHAATSAADTVNDQPEEKRGAADNPQEEKTEPVQAAAVSEDQEPAEKTPFQKLQEINPDITAWITLPNTGIDYPILQGSSNYSYINKDVYGNFSLAGSIFLDTRNDREYQDNYSLVYGHDMSQHRMFGDINLFKDEDFFRENRLGMLLLADGAHLIESLAVIVAPASDSGLFNPDNWTRYTGEEILQAVQENNLYSNERGIEALRAKVEAGEELKIISLTTCSNEYSDARTILLTILDP